MIRSLPSSVAETVPAAPACAAVLRLPEVALPFDDRAHATMRASRTALTLNCLLLAAGPLAAQDRAPQPDSVRAQILPVLRAFYLNLGSQNWEALGAYVLSPKLLERRGAPGDLQMVARDRTRGRGSAAVASAPRMCPSSASPMLGDAVIQVDGDWADVSVPRCSGPSPGVDHFGMLYFEQRWRFIYTDLFETSTAETAGR